LNSRQRKRRPRPWGRNYCTNCILPSAVC
jgi:hypothetical protein